MKNICTGTITVYHTPILSIQGSVDGVMHGQNVSFDILKVWPSPQKSEVIHCTTEKKIGLILLGGYIKQHDIVSFMGTLVVDKNNKKTIKRVSTIEINSSLTPQQVLARGLLYTKYNKPAR